MADHSLDELRAFWQSSDFDLATDAWLVSTPEGRVIGTADIDHKQHVRLYSFMRVHPEFRGQGVEEQLLRLTEARAQEHIELAPSHARVALHSWISPADTTTGHLHEQEGYSLVQIGAWRWLKDKAPLVPAWPRASPLRTRRARKVSVYVMMERLANEDHWGHMPSAYEEFAIKQDSFDPALTGLERSAVGGIIK
jgi:GNAT superfamily N-acetyltransferase